jgi:PhzF family phenazine biosynthesis protein
MVDVLRLSAFTDGDNGGNPAGIAFVDEFPDDAEMMAIAKRIGYSETAFLRAQAGTDNRRWRTRYFAPEAEIAFCGHATIAIGAALGDRIGAGKFELALNEADASVTAEKQGEHWSSTLTSPRTWSRQMSSDLAGQFLREFDLKTADLADGFQPMLANAGITTVVLPLRDRDRLKNMKYKLEPMKALMRANDVTTVNLIFREADGKTVHSRNAFASGGVYEDPATGAAAAALGGLLRDLDKIVFTNNAATFDVRQGDDMQKPCRLRVTVSPQRGAPVQVSGSVRKIVPPAQPAQQPAQPAQQPANNGPANAPNAPNNGGEPPRG